MPGKAFEGDPLKINVVKARMCQHLRCLGMIDQAAFSRSFFHDPLAARLFISARWVKAR